MCRKAVSGGVPTLWPSALWIPCHHQVHTFVGFTDIKKTFNSCWVEATLVRLQNVGMSGRLWHLLANFLCGILSRSIWATWLPNRGLTLASHKGGSSHLSPCCRLVSALWTRTRSVTCANFTRTTWSSLLCPRPTFTCFGHRACVGSSLAVLVWYWPQQIGGYGLWSSPRPP